MYSFLQPFDNYNIYEDEINNPLNLSYNDIFITEENIPNELSFDILFPYDKGPISLKTEKDIADYTIEAKNSENEDKNITNSLPIQYTFEKIKKEIFPKINVLNEIKDKLLENTNLLTIKKHMNDSIFFLNKKRKRKKGKIKYIVDDEEKKKLGRKKLDDFTKGRHTIFSGDNIIKKIKIKFFEYMNLFLNKVLNSLYLNNSRNIPNKKNLIKSLNYKMINTMKKETELSLLSKTLKEIFSNDISSKFKCLPPNYNKKLIDKILIEEKDNKNIMFAFNLTFREWIDIFTHKKEIETIKNFDINKMKELTKLFDHVDGLLLEIYKNYNTNYLVALIIYIYNYERWFYIKKGRKKSLKQILK